MDATASATATDTTTSDATTTDTAATTTDTAATTTTTDTAGNISNLTVEPNPNNVLSAFVSWTTTEPSTSVVQFGVDTLTWEVEDATLVTEHRVLVIGMRAQTTYQIRALSSAASSSVAGDTTFTSGTLPAQIPVAEVHVLDPAKVQPGWTLMNVQKGDGTPGARSSAPPAAVIYDSEGQPVWYFINGTQTERGGAISADMTDKGVLMGPTDTSSPVEVDWAGNVLWKCADTTCGSGGTLSHHAGKLSNGDHVIMRDTRSGSRTSQIFQELDTDNQVSWSLGVEDLVSPPGNATGDWAHGNSITVQLDQDAVYISCRWLGVMKARYSDKTPLWHLPASYGASGLGDMTFVPADSQFTDIHDPEIHDDGTILFFDNGGYNGQIQEGNPSSLHSRAVEYQIDETNKTATLVWEFPGSYTTDAWYKQDFYVPFWGDADRLANGNVLITAGRRGVQDITPQSRVFEVSKADGEVVWELMLPRDHGVYRAERLYPYPLIKPIAP